MPPGRKVGRDPSDIVFRWEPSSPSPKRGQSPQFSADVYCSQTAGWIKMPLDMDVGIGPGHIVLDGDPAPPPSKRGPNLPPIFGPCLMWPNGWMDQNATWYDGRPRPGQHYVTCGPSSTPPLNGHSPHSIFGPCLLWPNGWMDHDATWYEGRPRPKQHCVGGPSSPKKGTAPPPPNFGP